MTTPDNTPPMPEQEPDQAFSFTLEIKGTAQDPETIRRLLNAKLGLEVMGLQAEHGFSISMLKLGTAALSETVQAPELSPAGASDNANGPEETEAPEAPEPSLFTSETQESFDTTIDKTFLSEADVARINGEEPEELSDEPEDKEQTKGSLAIALAGNAYSAAAEKLGGNELEPISSERQGEFVDALKQQGIYTVRHAVILGLDTVRSAVEHLRPTLKRRRFDAQVATLTQGIVDTISDDAYAILEKRLPDDESTKGMRPVDTPLTIDEIAKFSNDPAQIPARAVQTAAVQSFGHFPDAWAPYTLAQLNDPEHRDWFIGAADDVSRKQAEVCLTQAAGFAKRLAELSPKA